MYVRLAILLTLSLTAVSSGTAAPADPNGPAANPRFATGEPKFWAVYELGPEGKSKVYVDPGSMRPTCLAEFFLPRTQRYGNGTQVLKHIIASPLAQKFSKAQRDFLAQGYAVAEDMEPDRHAGYYPLWFYAVSEEDARTMALAFLDFLTSESKRMTAETRVQLDKAKERLQQNQAALPKKKGELDVAVAGYSKVKNENYYLFSDEEALQTAKEVLLQMEKEARIVELDLAGVRGKLKVIDRYINEVKTTGKPVPPQLETMKTEQMVELSGLEARREAIGRFGAIPREFVALNSNRETFTKEVRLLTHAIEDDTHAVEETTRSLEQPTQYSYLLPPKIFDDTVVIHPVSPAQ
jgi:hypothetical protein